MTTKKAFILTEGSTTIGIGHITRCLSLHDELKKRHFSVSFIIYGDLCVKPLLKKKKYFFINWISNNKKRDVLIEGSDCIIIDSYLAPAGVYRAVSKQTNLLVCIDDYDRLSYPPGVIIRASRQKPRTTHYSQKDKIHSNSSDYYSKELSGNNFQLLRKEFLQVPALRIRDKIQTFFITFGGDDIRGLSPKILDYLIKNYPNQKKIVIVGPAYKKGVVHQIMAMKDRNTIVKKNATASEMSNLMRKSDIAISAGGQTINELARIGLPTITIEVADNQRWHLKNWSDSQFIHNMGSYRSIKLANLGDIINKLRSIQRREKISSIGRKIIDGKGPKRIVDEIIKGIIYGKRAN